MYCTKQVDADVIKSCDLNIGMTLFMNQRFPWGNPRFFQVGENSVHESSQPRIGNLICPETGCPNK